MSTHLCVVGGWTEPRGSRPFFGGLLLGVFADDDRLRYVGHARSGFSDTGLGVVWARVQPLRTKRSPFVTMPRTAERAFWIRPELVVEVNSGGWTGDGRLRQPTFVRVRGDVNPQSVRAEGGATPMRDPHSAKTVAADRSSRAGVSKASILKVLNQLQAIDERGGDGVLDLPAGDRLPVTNLRKVFWPALKLTKGDLFRHYLRAAMVILPVLDGRPLVLKRYPNGVAGKPFYQHRAPEKVPDGVRVETVATGSERRPHFIGGGLKTLLYTAQLASISQDPWFSRADSQHAIDHVALDLDPPDDLPFSKVLDLARWVHEELDALGVPGFPKTSGSGGLHVYVPMPPSTSYEAGLLFAQIVATVVASKHAKLATIERAVAARGRRIYVDYLQNIQGKTLASAYSVRANDFAGVSTPLTWEEVDEGVRPQDFTLANFADRLASTGDLWAALRKAKGANLQAVERYAR